MNFRRPHPLVPIAKLVGLIGLVFAIAMSATTANAMALSYSAFRIGGGNTAIRAGEHLDGDEKISILIKYMNDGPAPAAAGAILFTLPAGCYPVDLGAALTASVDGGHTFGRVRDLQVIESGVSRPARDGDVTVLRLSVTHALAPGAGGEIRLIAALH
jgi:hypothetical protein